MFVKVEFWGSRSTHLQSKNVPHNSFICKHIKKKSVQNVYIRKTVVDILLTSKFLNMLSNFKTHKMLGKSFQAKIFKTRIFPCICTRFFVYTSPKHTKLNKTIKRNQKKEENRWKEDSEKFVISIKRFLLLNLSLIILCLLLRFCRPK